MRTVAGQNLPAAGPTNGWVGVGSYPDAPVGARGAAVTCLHRNYLYS